MGDRLAERPVAGLLVTVSGRRSRRSGSATTGDAVDGPVAGDLAVLAQVGQELIAAPVPGPFLELEAQAVDFFVEEPLRIDVAGDDPALLAIAVDGRLGGGVAAPRDMAPLVSQAKLSGSSSSSPSHPTSCKQGRHLRHAWRRCRPGDRTPASCLDFTGNRVVGCTSVSTIT